MNTPSGTVVQAGVPAIRDSAKTSSRESLVVPVIFIISISFLTACGLVWITAEILEQNAKATTQHLANTMLKGRIASLQQLASDYAWWDGAAQTLMARRDQNRIAESLGSRLAKDHDLSASMVIGSDDRTIIAFVDGQRTDLDAFRFITEGLQSLVARARQTTEGRSKAVVGLINISGQIHVIAVAVLAAGNPTQEQAPPAQRPVLILTRAFDKRMLAEGAAAFALSRLSIFPQEPPDSYFSVPLKAVDSRLLGHLAWRSPRVGDVLLWWLLPSLACALIAMTYMLYQFFRSTDTVLEREAHLISSIKRERELRDLKSRFVSMVSHELRTPLSTIRSAADLLDLYEDRMTPDDRRRELGAIRDAVVGLNRMMEEVMALGRSDAVVEAHNTRLTLGDFCQELWNETVQVDGSKHRFVLAGSAIRRNVVIDDTLFRAVLANLLQNAIKYSPGCEEVRVEIDEQEDDCVIKVIDHGRGISAEERDRIFEAFHRGTSSKSTNGTGLGLAVAKAAAERLGGHIDVESEPGNGTTFEFVVPGLLQTTSPSRRKEEP